MNDAALPSNTGPQKCDDKRGREPWTGGGDRHPSEKPGVAETFDSSPLPTQKLLLEGTS